MNYLIGILFLALSAGVLANNAMWWGAGCGQVGSGGYYDFNSIEKEEGRKIGSTNLFFSICRKMKYQCKTPANEKGYLIVKPSEDVCSEAKIRNDPVFEELTEAKGVFVRFNDSGTQLSITITCNETEEGFSYSTTDNINIHAVSKSACPYMSLSYLFSKYSYIFTTAFVLMGLFLALLGQRFYKHILFIIGALIVIGILMFLVYQLALAKQTVSRPWIFWLCLGVSVAIGCTAGYFVYAFERLFFVILGLGLGAVAGLYVYNLVLVAFCPSWVLYLVIAAGAIVCGILTYFCEKPLIIFSTSIIGSYLAIRGISFVAGKFPSEFDLYDVIKAGNLPWELYLYLGSMALLAVISIFVQCKYTKRDEEPSEETLYSNLKGKPGDAGYTRL